jgi:putative two-component system response regulator
MQGDIVLIADDDSSVRSLMGEVVTRLGHRPIYATDGLEALEMVRCEKPSVILLDIQMPKMDGNEVLRRIKGDPKLAHIPVIVISGLDDLDMVVQCLELGAEDYIAKPARIPMLHARLDNAFARKRAYDKEQYYRQQLEASNANLERRVIEQVAELTVAHRETLFALSKLADSRDPETGEHLERVREYSKILAECLSRQPKYRDEIGPEFIENIYVTSPLHDIGKVGVPDRVLLKPGVLTDEEFEIIKFHTVIGAETLRYVEARYPGNRFVRMGIEIAESHHEKWTGGGYPHGTSGEAIPLSARIVAVADVYDVLTSKRCYKEAFDHEVSRDRIVESRGSHFDPGIVDAFLEIEINFSEIRTQLADTEKIILE